LQIRRRKILFDFKVSVNIYKVTFIFTRAVKAGVLPRKKNGKKRGRRTVSKTTSSKVIGVTGI